MKRLLLLLVILLQHLPVEGATVAVLRPDGADFVAAEQALLAELPKDWHVVRLTGSAPDVPTLETWLAASAPAVVVAMDNEHIRQAETATRGRVPVVAMMGLNLKQQLQGHAGVCGVAYEPPIWSLVTGFAARTGTMPRRVLLPHRGSVHAAEIADATRQLARQGITAVPLDVETQASGPAAQAAWLVRNLTAAAVGADVVVVPADNVLVDARSLPAWLDAARRSGRPFLSPVARFIDERHSFCAYGAAVDHERLGAQVADLVLQLVNHGATPVGLGVEYLVGIGEQLDANVLRRLGLMVQMPKEP